MSRTAVILIILIGISLTRATFAHPPSTSINNPGVSAKVIRWIEDLDSDEFVIRSSATANLIKTGRPAINPVVSAIPSGSLELVSRGIHVLQELALSGDIETETDAHRALERLVDSPATVAARRASVALDRLLLVRSGRARDLLKRHGARIDTLYDGLDDRTERLEIGQKWNGTDDDLFQLQWLKDTRTVVLDGPQVTDTWLARVALLPQLHTLSIVNGQITDRGLKKLVDLPHLSTLRIWHSPITNDALGQIKEMANLVELHVYGTKMTREVAESLENARPELGVYFKRGAFLGIQGRAVSGEQQCRIDRVHPGSPAEKAGLVGGDVILEYNGEAVKRFSELTELIADNRPNDLVNVTIQRKTVIVKQVRLGQWDASTLRVN